MNNATHFKMSRRTNNIIVTSIDASRWVHHIGDIDIIDEW